MSTEQTPSNPTGSCLTRLLWMMVGPMLLLVLSITIINSGNGWLTGLDITFFVVLAGMLLARWFDFRAGDPRTAAGDPATPGHLRWYVPLTLVIGLAVWAAANAIGNHWPGS